MRNLSVLEIFTGKVKAINSRFRESTSSLKAIFSEIKQYQRRKGKDARLRTMSDIMLTKKIAGVSKKKGYEKYSSAVDWLSSRWGIDNETLGKGVGRFWMLLEIEYRLNQEINRALERKPYDLNPLLPKLAELSTVLIAQYDLMRKTFRTDPAQKALLKSFGPLSTPYWNKIKNIITITTAPDQFIPTTPQRDLKYVLFLAIVKINAFELGRNLLDKIGDNLNNRRLCLVTSGEYKADFVNANSLTQKPELKIYKSNLGDARFMAAKLKSGGLKYFDKSMLSLYKISGRGARIARNISLAFVARMYTWHHLFIGIKGRKAVWYLSPNFVQAYHELCHIVRLLEGAALPINSSILPPKLEEFYDNDEEYFNIRVAPFSERRLLHELGLPLRLTHKGIIMPAPVHGFPSSDAYNSSESSYYKYNGSDLVKFDKLGKEELKLN
ncbi:MAG: hypothetical protein ACYS8Y_05420 [Planctomycetota bacterium]|jgi:hypothetical protein